MQTRLDKRAFITIKLNQINHKTPFLSVQGLTMNDHQTWLAQVLDKFIES